MKAIFLCDSKDNINRVYGEKEREEIRALCEFDENIYTSNDSSDAEVAFSTWGMPALDEERIKKQYPNLKAVFYGAGSVQFFARPFLDSGIKVFSAWQANAVPVIEYTLSQIELASKGAFILTRLMRTDVKTAHELVKNYQGLYDIKIGILGLGAIGSGLAKRLKEYSCEVYACDAFADDARFDECGAKRQSMEWIFSNCDIVTNHIANLPETVGIIKRKYLFSMKKYATFINTGRGAQLHEDDLYELLKGRKDLTALLDVLTDEARAGENPLMQLDNCFITPHIAGSLGNEVRRMAHYMAEEFSRYKDGQPLRYEVTHEMLKTMA